MNLGPQMASITGKLQSNFPETEQKKINKQKQKPLLIHLIVKSYMR